MDCIGCVSKDSEIQFLRGLIDRLMEKPKVEPGELKNAYRVLSDGSLEYDDGQFEEGEDA